MKRTVAEIEAMLGLELFDYQKEIIQEAAKVSPNPDFLRVCLYYRTGAGKSLTALALLAAEGRREALIIAPPSTHADWLSQAESLGIDAAVISHAIFRQPTYKLRKDRPIILDEFHLLGGHTGKGWTKMDRAARVLQSDLLVLSATPNYNDIERLYCIEHVLDPAQCRGGFLAYLATRCKTMPDKYSMTPKVLGLFDYATAEDYLCDLPYVFRVKEIYNVPIGNLFIDVPPIDKLFFKYRYDKRSGRMVASQMEERHKIDRYLRVNEQGEIHPELWDELAVQVGAASTPTLVYCSTATVAEAVHKTALAHGAKSGIITGKTTKKRKQEILDNFRRSKAYDILVGTDSIATGTDGLDKVCDQLILFQDTPDDSQRKQLIGRILPRGIASTAAGKVVTRFNPQ